MTEPTELWVDQSHTTAKRLDRRTLVKLALAGAGGVALAAAPRLAAFGATSTPVVLTVTGGTIAYHTLTLAVTVTVTFADGTVVPSTLVDVVAIGDNGSLASNTIGVTVVNGVGSGILTLNPIHVKTHTAPVVSGLVNDPLYSSNTATSPIVVVPTTVTIVPATVNVQAGATSFLASATFTYPDGSPVELGRAMFGWYGAFHITGSDVVNGQASLTISTPSGVPAGTHPYAVDLNAASDFAGGFVNGAVLSRKFGG